MSNYQVLARKWRPQQFEEIVGQDHVVQTLVNAIRGDRLAHAYLFVGPRGTGKTSTARVFAKALNCADGPTDRPCDRCPSCEEIARGGSMDVLEIDGASNNGVEQVRELRAGVQYAPTRGRFKIYIIDEVHMLTQQAFNALLKTLEEPPAHVKFFFATTEPQRIPATIISRCQRFDLRRIPRREIVERLSQIAAAEKVDVDPSALDAVARGADGALRDAESALDQLISFCGDRITESEVIGVFGLAAADQVRGLARAVLTGDTQQVLTLVRELSDAGKDLFRLLLDLIEELRALLLCRVSGDPAALLDLPAETIEEIRAAAGEFETDRILAVLEILAETETSLRWASSKRIALELGLVRALRAARGVSVDRVLERIAELKESLESGNGGDDPPASGPATDSPSFAARPVREDPGLFAAKSAAAHGSSPVAPTAPAADSAGTTLSAADAVAAAAPVVGEATAGESTPAPALDLDGAWAALLGRFRETDLKIYNYLKAGAPVALGSKDLRVAFGPRAHFHRDSLSRTRNRAAVEEVLAAILGRPVRLVPVDGVDPDPAGPPDPGVETVGSPSERTDAPAPGGADGSEDPRRRGRENAVVRQLIQLFDGKLLDVRV